MIGDTIIIDDGREPRNEEESLSPLSSPLSEIQDLFEGLRVDESGDAGPPESRQNASKKKGKSSAQPSRSSSRLRGQNPTEKGINNSEGFDTAIAAAEEAKKTGDENAERFALLVALYSTANQEPTIPQNIAEATSGPDKEKWL